MDVSFHPDNRGWKLFNNTIVETMCDERICEGIHLYNIGPGAEVRNNILYRSGYLLQHPDSEQSNNLFHQTPNPPSGNGSFEADPQFVNKEAEDFQLRASSPAIDRGIDLGLGVDILGKPVPIGSGVEIGSYEYK